jgi:prepilin-type N-terminal cleavage/methylation domain-containing protein
MKKDNRGFSLLELLMAIAIMAVVGALVGQILAVSVQMYRRTQDTSRLQKSSQMISQRLERAIMGAKGLSVGTTAGTGTYLYLGDNVPTENQDTTMGPLIWFDEGQHCVYFWESGTVHVESGNLTAAIRTAMTGSGSREYLLGTDVKSLSFELPAAGASDRAVTYTLTLQRSGGAEYTVTNRVTPRNLRSTTP